MLASSNDRFRIDYTTRSGPGLKFERAGVVIIKAHTPGANRKIVLILDRYIAVHLTRTIFLILYNPIDKICQVVYKNNY